MCCFFFNDTATTEIYTLSLHDALPIFVMDDGKGEVPDGLEVLDYEELLSSASPVEFDVRDENRAASMCYTRDRKSTRLNSSHANISYAVFCLKKKKHILHTYACAPQM